jgi:hypothetical protein
VSENHSHQEFPRTLDDANMLNAVGAEESLYVCLGLNGGKVVGIGICEYLTQAESIALLQQAIQLIKAEEET